MKMDDKQKLKLKCIEIALQAGVHHLDLLRTAETIYNYITIKDK